MTNYHLDFAPNQPKNGLVIEVLADPNPTTIELNKVILEQSGIMCFIRVSERWEKPGLPPHTALWIERDDDFTKAARLIREHRFEVLRFRPEWTCLSCSEINSGKVEICRKCKEVQSGLFDRSLYEWLERVRLKPGMYMGGEPSIVRLQAFLAGFSCGLGMVKLSLRDEDEFHGFHNWVAKKLGFYESTSGWCNMIREKCASDEEAFKQFFVLLDEFRKELKQRATGWEK